MTSPTLSFDGTDDYVQTTYGANFSTSNFSVGGWVYLNDTGKFTLASTYDSNVTGWILDDDNGNGNYRFWTTGGETVVGSSLITNEWHHLWGQRLADGTLQLYINGELDASATSTNSDVSNTTNVHLGKRGIVSSAYLNGQLDDVRVSPFQFSRDNVKKVVDGHIIGDESAIWSMNEGTGTVLTDATSNNNSGTINGATWSIRSGGNTYDWSTAADWDGFQSQDDVNHEWGTESTDTHGVQVNIGQPSDHLTTTSEEAFYPMQRVGDDTQIYDVSPANNHSVSVNGATNNTEMNRRWVGSVSFDGTDSYASLPSNVWSNTNFVAAEAWVYPRRTSAGGEFIWDKGSDIRVGWNDLTSQGFSVRIQGDNTGSFGPTGLSTNTWHHVNIYWDIGTEVGMSVNGSSWYTYSTTDGVTNGMSNGIHLGQQASGSNNFDGKMTELRFVTGQKIPIEDSLYLDYGRLATGRKS